MCDSKQCPKCGEIKPFSDFGKKKDTKDGLRIECKVCNRENAKKWRKANPDKVIAMNKKYREANRDTAWHELKKWREANHDKYKAIQRKYRQFNRDKIRDMNRKYSENNPDKIIKMQTIQYLKKTYSIDSETLKTDAAPLVEAWAANRMLKRAIKEQK